MSEDQGHKKVSAFDFLNDLTKDKTYLFNEMNRSAYSPFFINRGMSQHMDCIFIAEAVNKMPHVDKELQHDFYFYSLAARKRYGKWAKAEEDDDVDTVMKAYKVNRVHARQYLNLMSQEQLEELKNRTRVGGKS